MLDRPLANCVAAAHGAAVVFMLTGGLLSWRWPRLVLAHLPFAAGILLVNLAGADCPLTTLELRLREQAGLHPYTDGFIGHYLVEPVHSSGMTPGVRIGIYLTALVPNAVAYGVLVLRRERAGPVDARLGPGPPERRTGSYLVLPRTLRGASRRTTRL